MSDDRSTRRDAAALETRKALIAAARTAFGERGFAGASLADIAAAARATTGALYHHFADKRALFEAVAEDVEAELVRFLTAGAPTTNDPWELLSYAVAGTLDYAARPGVARVIFKEAPTVIGPLAWREIEMRYGLGSLHMLLTTLRAAGRLAFEPEIVAGVLFGALVHTVDVVTASTDPEHALAAGKAAMARTIGAFALD